MSIQDLRPRCAPAGDSHAVPGSEAGSLTADFIANLRDGYQMSRADLACHNAVTNNDLKSLALNRGVVRGDDGHFSHRIRSGEITDQKQSGRCWMFAALNTLRPHAIRDRRMRGLEFSASYLQFWDKLERANLFLESIIELRDASHLDRDWEIVNKFAVHDGGWWNYLVALVEKYGVVPVSAMPETRISTDTDRFNHVLGRMLRARAVRILDQHRDRAGIDALRAEKEVALKDVYRFLVISFGEPPREFEWRYLLKNDDAADGGAMPNVEEDHLAPAERHTPRSFFREYVGKSLSEFVCLYNDPLNEPDRHYRFDRARNMIGSECMNFVNIGTGPMKDIAKASILAREPVWFAVDMGFDQSHELGLMERQLFDYEALFGVDLTIGKAHRTFFHAGASCHAMAIMGVDLAADGRPRKWLVENSHGKETGTEGRWTLHDSWFDEHVYTIIAHKRHVPEEILGRFEEEAVLLPAWYPAGPAMGPL